MAYTHKTLALVVVCIEIVIVVRSPFRRCRSSHMTTCALRADAAVLGGRTPYNSTTVCQRATNYTTRAKRTDIGLAEEAPGLGRGRRGRGVLDLRRRRRARRAHAVSTVHFVESCVCWRKMSGLREDASCSVVTGYRSARDGRGKTELLFLTKEERSMT